MCYDTQLDYSDLLNDMDNWGQMPPMDAAEELARRVRVRMTQIMEEIRGEKAPAGYFDYKLMKRVEED